uniref:Uncharacterized protein n=1 Tax=Populus alba TaxID=43335 RepID=A0A4U5QVL6_POPAL|nr:hypothetical protein D5086_0000051410 [Populus alba]
MKVKSSIQINIKEISTVKVQVQAWDVPENIFITNLPADKGRSIIGLGGLNMMKTLEKLITFSSDMEGLTNLSFKHHLAIIGYMVFQTFMICAHFKSKWAEERRVMTEAID